MAIGRPKKLTADYFPHYADDVRIIKVLESKWGNDGYAFYYKLLEILCRSDRHFYDCSTPASLYYLAAATGIETAVMEQMLKTLTELGEIDGELWNDKKVLWCQGLVDSLSGQYKKRTVALPLKPFTQPPAPVAEQVKPKVAAEKAKSSKSPKKPKKKAVVKQQYAEFVFMTEEEYGKLVDKYGEDMTKHMVEILDNYKGSSGRKYASDYRAILNWVVNRAKEEQEKKGGANRGLNADRGNNNPQNKGFKPSDCFRRM